MVERAKNETMAILSTVRLRDPAAQPEIGDATGTVHSLGDGWIEVAWPGWRSWCRAGDLEACEMARN